MKKGITISIVFVLAVIVGGASVVCFNAPVEVPEEPTTGGLTERGLEVKADIVEREARGFVQYTGNVTVNVTVIEVVNETEVQETFTEAKLEMPYVGPLAYPENLEGFDSVEARLILCEDALNIQLDGVDTLVQQRYQNGGKSAYTAFYTAFWQDRLNDYAKVYNIVGNTILTDSEQKEFSLSVDGFNFTSPWGARNLGNGSFVYDIQTEKISFVGAEDIALGGYITVNESGAVIEGMFYTYMGNNATLPGETEVAF